MRRLHFATLLFSAISILSIGCRQTSGPSAGGSMSPAAQSPTFNPFGGATRVTPPPSGTSAAQNPYIGGPPGQTNTAVGVANGFAAAAVPGATAPVVGSGVQPAGFVRSGAGAAPATQAGFGTNSFTPAVNTAMPSGAVQAGYGAAAAASLNSIRAGGMPVNDLTRAPLPPGYPSVPRASPQPVATTYQPPSSSLAPTAQGPSNAPLQPTFNPVPPPSVPANGSVPATSVNQFQQPQQGTAPQQWQSTGTSVPEAEIASHRVTVTTSPRSVLVPATPGTTPAAPTVQANSATDSSDLMWRRPGS